jgi:type IV secretion system protein VirB10
MDKNTEQQETQLDGMPSINDRNGTASRSTKSKVIAMTMLAVGLAAVVGCSYYGITRLKSSLSQTGKQTQSADAPVKRRTFESNPFAGNPPPLPASMAVAASDAGASAPVTAPASAQAAPIEVQPSRSSGGTTPPTKVVSRYDSDILLVSDSSRDSAAARRVNPASDDMGSTSGSGSLTLGGNSGASGNKSSGALSGLLTATDTPLSVAGKMGNLSLTMAKTTPVPCALRTAINSRRAGQTSCVVIKDMLSANGRTVLLDRGSVVELEYGPVTKQGEDSIAILASRIRTPQGVAIDVGSLATDQLGRSGAPGYLDNHWGQRIGASLLLAFIQDGISYATTQAQSGSSGTVIYQNSSDTTNKLAEKVLDSTINIPPTILKNQGELISIELSRDLDFSKVYSLEAE